jgi:hypothetical protein
VRTNGGETLEGEALLLEAQIELMVSKEWYRYFKWHEDRQESCKSIAEFKELISVQIKNITNQCYGKGGDVV